jgi:hypothetical protein
MNHNSVIIPVIISHFPVGTLLGFFCNFVAKVHKSIYSCALMFFFRTGKLWKHIHKARQLSRVLLLKVELVFNVLCSFLFIFLLLRENIWVTIIYSGSKLAGPFVCWWGMARHFNWCPSCFVIDLFHIWVLKPLFTCVQNLQFYHFINYLETMKRQQCQASLLNNLGKNLGLQ